MTHEVTLPSGEIVEFPDNMSDDDIATQLKDYPGAQQAPPAAAPAPNLPGFVPPAAPGAPDQVIPAPDNPLMRVGSVGFPALVKGVAEGVGLPGDIANAVLPAPIAQRIPMSAEIKSMGPLPGIINAPQAQPRNLLEKAIAGGGENIGAGLPYALLGPGAALARGQGVAQAGSDLAKALLQTGFEAGGSGVGGAVGQDIAPGPVGEALGMFGGLGVGGAVRGAVGRAATATFGSESPTVEAMQRLAMTPRLAGDVTGSDVLKGIQSTAMRAPGGGRAFEALQQTLDEFGRAGDDVASKLGKPVTLEDAGGALQNRARQWYQQWKGDQTTAWNDFEQTMPGTQPTDMSGVDQTLGRLGGRGSGAPAVSAIMGDPVAQDLQAALQRDLPSTVPGYANLPFQTVKEWRSKVGEKLDQSLMANSADQTAWRALYGSLSDAMKNTAQRVDADAVAQGLPAPGAAAAFNKAANITSQGQTFNENVASNIINHQDPARNSIPAAGAANFALSGSGIGGSQGGQRLQAIRDTMGDPAADELAAFKLRSMVSAKPFGQSAAGDAASPAGFMTAWNTLSPGAKDALYGSNPEVRARIDDMLTVAGAMKDTATRFGNSSGTTGAGMHALTWGSALAAPAELAAGYAAHGLPGLAMGAGTAAAPFLIGPTAANLTARPTLTRLMALPSQAPAAAQRWLTRLGTVAPMSESALAPLIAQGDVPRTP
jgi:hypothetical protein